ncbi:YggS family pyridoxal phosphate-dependent enzyme [Candidatus Pelagibacter sp.]|nr:YggS family pyridoxal phosphate-dependent enzyme [Candidatus Pelagibacter sp.]
MHKSITNLISIQNELKSGSKIDTHATIIAVSKTFPLDSIQPLIDYGHCHFGENKVQEAVNKWTNIKDHNKDIKLHMIGKLQTNKVKYVIPLFDYIHSLDNIKLAEKIASEQKKINKNLKIFIQVNIGNESQKNGIEPVNLKVFYDKCVKEFKLNIVGLMCIPPQNSVATYFADMQKLNKLLKLDEISMGMSADYLTALNCGSTFLRIGSKIFGDRV